MNSVTCGGLACRANHIFCLEVTEDFTMGHIIIPEKVSLETDVSQWWDDTFHEGAIRAMTKIMDLVQQVILKTENHLHQAQVEANVTTKDCRDSDHSLSPVYVHIVGLGP